MKPLKILEIMLELTQRLQADGSIRVDLTDLISELELLIKVELIGDEE